MKVQVVIQSIGQQAFWFYRRLMRRNHIAGSVVPMSLRASNRKTRAFGSIADITNSLNCPDQLIQTRKKLPEIKSHKKLHQYAPWNPRDKINEMDCLIKQFNDCDLPAQQIIQINAQMHNACERMVESIYLYGHVQESVKQLNNLAYRLRQDSIMYKAIAFSGLLLYQYSSYSLSLFYIDKALRVLNTKDSVYDFQRLTEIQLYKTAAQIILSKGDFQEAKQLVYKYLRKAWLYGQQQEQLIAYDFLGRLYLQSQNIKMSRYFHDRMCCGAHERPEWIKMSNVQLTKYSISKNQYFCGQNISVFTKNDGQFNRFLETYYQSQADDFARLNLKTYSKKQNIMNTHRSQNRIIKYRHSLERNLMHDRSSTQVHFITEKDSVRIRKIITQFSKFLFRLHRKLHNIRRYTENRS